MSAPPFMQMYWSDYFGDTRHLSCEQHGAYLQLLGAMWLSDGALPDCPKKLARLTSCTASRWAKIEADVLALFERADGKITHRRVSLELEKAREKSIKRAEAGSRGGTAKALKDKKADVAIATDLPQHLPEPEPERKNTEADASVGATPKRRSRFCPHDWMPSSEDLAAGVELGFVSGDLERELAKMREYEFKDPKSNWSMTFRRWLRTAAERAPRNGPAKPASTRESRRAVWSDIAADEAAARVGRDGPPDGSAGVQLRLVGSHSSAA